MSDWAGRLARLAFPRKSLVAALAGAAATLALPPLYIVPAFFLAFPLLFLLLRGAIGKGRAFVLGWAFGFGHFATGFYWIAVAFIVNESVPDLAGPPAVAGLAAVMAFYPALAMLGFQLLRRHLRGSVLAEIILFALLWSLSEWLRGHLFTGFPWNLAASIWAFSPAMLQSLSLWGAYGLGLLTLLAASLPALWLVGRPWPVLAMLAGLLLLFGGGMWRLSADQGLMAPDMRLRLVQGNVKQGEKWRADRLLQNFDLYLRLSAARAVKPVTHILWPETAAPYFLNAEADARAAIASVVPRDGYVIAGAPGYSPAVSGNAARITNSLFAIDDGGRLRAGYDKAHLVPFGEYLPFRSLLEALGFKRFVPGMLGTDFSPGPGPETLHLPGTPAFSPLICYEVIFPGAVVDEADRPHWILNVTNDGWYGLSAGPYQHLAAALMRAVEEGLPVVRVAGTGISAVISPYGRILQSLPLEAQGILDSNLPRRVENPTFFARSGDWSYLGLLFILAALATCCGRGATGDMRRL